MWTGISGFSKTPAKLRRIHPHALLLPSKNYGKMWAEPEWNVRLKV
jgi:hypothetical protein